MVSLEHDKASCAGLWRPQPVQQEIYWRCEGCQAIAIHSETIAQLAVEENLRGTHRRLLNDTLRWFRGEDLDERGQRTLEGGAPSRAW